MLAFASGVEAAAPVALLGYGALGSCIADFVVRAGVPKIAAIDKDDIAPHNLARHTATVDDLYARKVMNLKRLAGKVTFFEDEIICEIRDSDILTLSDEDLGRSLDGYRLIIDATAEERIRKRLARVSLPSVATLLRAEILGGGSLGALFVTGPGNNPNLIDLYYALCAQAVEERAIEKWLRGEQAAGTSAEELLVGMGCASATTRMPKYVVAQHAAAFMPTIMAGLNGALPAGVGINALDDGRTPLGWRWFESGEVTVLEPSDAPGWQVRLSPRAVKKLTALRTAYGSVETGGYLYGGYDFAVQQIYVVEVSDVPPATKQSATAIELGPAGQTPLERKIIRRAGGKLARVGTWHSHPKSGPGMSTKDRKTIGKFRSEDQDKGVPTLLVISSAKGIGAHLWI